MLRGVRHFKRFTTTSTCRFKKHGTVARSIYQRSPLSLGNLGDLRFTSKPLKRALRVRSTGKKTKMVTEIGNTVVQTRPFHDFARFPSIFMFTKKTTVQITGLVRPRLGGRAHVPTGLHDRLRLPRQPICTFQPHRLTNPNAVVTTCTETASLVHVAAFDVSSTSHSGRISLRAPTEARPSTANHELMRL